MSFDWNKYEELADKLKQEIDEASKRTAISRLYYAIYHRAKIFLEENTTYSSSRNKPAHQQVWQTFVNIGGTHRSIGQNLKRLLENRISADYFDEITRIDDVLETSFRLAHNISTWLQQIEKQTEN